MVAARTAVTPWVPVLREILRLAEPACLHPTCTRSLHATVAGQKAIPQSQAAYTTTRIPSTGMRRHNGCGRRLLHSSPIQWSSVPLSHYPKGTVGISSTSGDFLFNAVCCSQLNMKPTPGPSQDDLLISLLARDELSFLDGGAWQPSPPRGGHFFKNSWCLMTLTRPGQWKLRNFCKGQGTAVTYTSLFHYSSRHPPLLIPVGTGRRSKYELAQM